MAQGGTHRLKHTFTAGELSERLGARLDFDRYKNGCKRLRNMTCQVQGPATRRPGFKFVYDLNRLYLDVPNGRVREIPFIFNEEQAYALIFFQAESGEVYMVIGYRDDLVHGTGTAHDYEVKDNKEYAGAGNDNTFSIPDTITYNSEVLTGLEADGTKQVLDPVTDYTRTINADNVVFNVSSTTAFTRLDVVMNVTSVAVPTDQVVALDLPVGFNIEQFDYSQSLDEIYIAQPNMQPIVIIRNAIDNWSWAAINFECFPEEWPHDNAIPPVPDYTSSTNWPETVTFHQQRLTYGGSVTHPQTVWNSVAGDFLNFGAFDHSSCFGTDPADAITFRLDSGTMNKIKWMISAKSLAIGTLGNEWTVQGANQAALTPQSLLAQRQTNMGSEKIRPLMVGLATLFVERHGRTVNEFKYEYTTDSYETSDRSVLATHFTDYYSIVDWTFQQMPDQVIWMAREDGALLGCTYQREHKVVGWHLHDTQGEFKALTAIPGQSRTDEVWAIIQREVNGVQHYYVERLEDEFTGEWADEGRFLDSHIVLSPVGNLVSGLGHLVGLEVDILADGTVHPSQVVSAAGEITLDASTYYQVVVGLRYVSEVRPYLPQLPMQDGTSFGRMQRITTVDIDFYKTLGGYIGRYDSEDGERVEELMFRRPIDPMGQQVPLFSGIYHYPFLEGYDRDAEYFIRQEQPLPMTVRGVVDTVEVYK